LYLLCSFVCCPVVCVSSIFLLWSSNFGFWEKTTCKPIVWPGFWIYYPEVLGIMSSDKYPLILGFFQYISYIFDKTFVLIIWYRTLRVNYKCFKNIFPIKLLEALSSIGFNYFHLQIIEKESLRIIEVDLRTGLKVQSRRSVHILI
jgi:hypothetical protein